METMKSFIDRVEACTGVAFERIPVVEEENAIRHIMCRRDEMLIVGMDDYPVQAADGREIFTTFGKVILK